MPINNVTSCLRVDARRRAQLVSREMTLLRVRQYPEKIGSGLGHLCGVRAGD